MRSLPAPDGTLGIIDVGAIALESGETLPDVQIAVQRWGQLNADRSNAVLVEHALTGDSHVSGPPDELHALPGWWDGMVGPGRPLDTDTWCIVATNVLGGCRGTTGPSSPAPDGKPWGSRFPRISIRDQVLAEVAFADAVGINSFAAVVGGSMGGMRVLEWVVGYSQRVRAALVLAVGARATADQIGTQTTQTTAIESDPAWHGGDYYGTGERPDVGIGLARRIALLTYRTEFDFDSRFANRNQPGEDPLRGGRYAVQSYLDHQADKLIARFDAGTYVILNEAMNRHDVGRGRGGIEAALKSTNVPVVVAGIDSDRLYPLYTQAELAEGLPGCAGLDVVNSKDGHDGFLTEIEAVGKLVMRTLELARS